MHKQEQMKKIPFRHYSGVFVAITQHVLERCTGSPGASARGAVGRQEHLGATARRGSAGNAHERLSHKLRGIRLSAQDQRVAQLGLCSGRRRTAGVQLCAVHLRQEGQGRGNATALQYDRGRQDHVFDV